MVEVNSATFRLPGPPLSNDTALVTLLDHGVVVGLGIRSAWEARNTRFDAQWVGDTLLRENSEQVNSG